MAAPFFFYFSLSFSFFFAHVSKCFSIRTGANSFSQNSHGTAFKTYYFSYFYPYYSSFPSSSFLIPLIAALKFSDVALQLSLVLSKPFVFPNCFYFFLFSLINAACYFEVNLFASELNYFLLDMKTILQAFACFYNAFLLNFLPHPSGHSTKSF